MIIKIKYRILIDVIYSRQVIESWFTLFFCHWDSRCVFVGFVMQFSLYLFSLVLLVSSFLSASSLTSFLLLGSWDLLSCSSSLLLFFILSFFYLPLLFLDSFFVFVFSFPRVFSLPHNFLLFLLHRRQVIGPCFLHVFPLFSSFLSLVWSFAFEVTFCVTSKVSVSFCDCMSFVAWVVAGEVLMETAKVFTTGTFNEWEGRKEKKRERVKERKGRQRKWSQDKNQMRRNERDREKRRETRNDKRIVVFEAAVVSLSLFSHRIQKRLSVTEEEESKNGLIADQKQTGWEMSLDGDKTGMVREENGQIHIL